MWTRISLNLNSFNDGVCTNSAPPHYSLTLDVFQQVRIQSAAQIAPPSAYGMGGDSDDDDDVPAIPDLDDVQV